MRASHCAVLAMLLLAGCPGSTSVHKDGQSYPDGAVDMPRFGDFPKYNDKYKPKVDVKPAADYWPSPDTKKPGDLWPWPADTYHATPFGCLEDSDCFGQLCCPTPWGVKLCANECPQLGK